MSIRLSLVLATLALGGSIGCTGDLGARDDGPGASSGVTNPSSGSAGDGLDVDATPGGDAPDLDHPHVDDEALPQPSAAIRRLSLAQLRASLPVLFGTEADGTTPITWRLPGGAQGLNQMAGSLGEPDYIEVTEENLEPSPMYVKFMDDLARDVCARAIAADLTRPAGATRVIARRADFGDTVASAPQAIDDNLRYLLLRLHAVKVADGDQEPIAGWRAVFTEAVAEATEDGVAADAATAEGWRAVCTGLVVSPDFHLY